MVRNRNLVRLVRRERLIAARALPWLPRWLHFLSRNRFESARKLASVKSPVLIVHGDLDRTIPVAEAQLLFAAANEPKKLMIIPGAGHNIFGSRAGTIREERQRRKRTMTNRRANCDMWSSPGFTVGAALRGRPRFHGSFC